MEINKDNITDDDVKKVFGVYLQDIIVESWGSDVIKELALIAIKYPVHPYNVIECYRLLEDIELVGYIAALYRVGFYGLEFVKKLKDRLDRKAAMELRDICLGEPDGQKATRSNKSKWKYKEIRDNDDKNSDKRSML